MAHGPEAAAPVAEQNRQHVVPVVETGGEIGVSVAVELARGDIHDGPSQGDRAARGFRKAPGSVTEQDVYVRREPRAWGGALAWGVDHHVGVSVPLKSATARARAKRPKPNG